MKRCMVVGLSLVFLLASLSAAPAAQKQTDSQDKKFVKEAALGGMFEVEAGKIASKRAASDEVRQYGERMVADHTKVNDELTQVANNKGMTPPKQLDQKHRAKLNKLEKLSGADFDKQYVDMKIQDHKKTIALFNREAKSGKDAELKSLASDTLPTLQEHLKLAQDLQTDTKGAGAQRTGNARPGSTTAGTGGTYTAGPGRVAR